MYMSTYIDVTWRDARDRIRVCRNILVRFDNPFQVTPFLSTYIVSALTSNHSIWLSIRNRNWLRYLLNWCLFFVLLLLLHPSAILPPSPSPFWRKSVTVSRMYSKTFHYFSIFFALYVTLYTLYILLYNMNLFHESTNWKVNLFMLNLNRLIHCIINLIAIRIILKYIEFLPFNCQNY